MSPGSETIVAVGPGPIVLLLLLAVGSALFLARLYREIDEPQPSGSGLHAAFPMMAVALTALFLIVQLSLPLSLGLLAALTVIRFRTPVKQPEEIAFVVAIVALAATLATLRVALAGVLLGTAVLAGIATKALRARQSVQGLLVISLPSGGLEQGAMRGLGRHGCRLQSVSIAGAEAVFSFRFAAQSESDIRAVERDLTRRLPLARATVLVDARQEFR